MTHEQWKESVTVWRQSPSHSRVATSRDWAAEFVRPDSSEVFSCYHQRLPDRYTCWNYTGSCSSCCCSCSRCCSCCWETVTLLSLSGPAASQAAGEGLTVHDHGAARFTLAPQPTTHALVDGPGRWTGVRAGGGRSGGAGPTSRPTGDGRTCAGGTASAVRGRRAARRAGRRRRRHLRRTTRLAHRPRLRVNFRPIVAGRQFYFRSRLWERRTRHDLFFC